MSHREQQSSDHAPARDATRLLPDSRPRDIAASATTTDARNEASLWNDWYERASPGQQQQAMLHALQQGILYSHQLETPAQASAAHRSLLSRLLNGQAKELEPLLPPDLECHDAELDRTQREAVARAIATPDVCLIQGFPGTGKSRLLVEILLQATQRGERVLFLAPTAVALDTVLERLGTHPTVCPIRCLAAEEELATLPVAIARLTMPERLRSYKEATLPAARAARDSAARTLEARLRQRTHWSQLEQLAEQNEQLHHLLQTTAQLREGLAVAVERLEQVSDSFRERWQTCQRTRREALEKLDSQMAGLQAELDIILGKQARLDSEGEAIRSLAEARQGYRVWTGSWWRAFLRRGLRDQVRDLEARRSELQSARSSLEQELMTRRNERAALETQHAETCRRLQDEEIASRRAQMKGELDSVTREQETVRERFQKLCQGLCEESRPREISRQAVKTAYADWERLREQESRQAESLEQWLKTVEEGVRTLPEKLAQCANVIAATTATLVDNASFQSMQLFDVLILEEAHQVTEAEFAAAARRARRWVLVGEPQPDGESIFGSRKVVRPAVLRPSLFQRLWQNLHTDPHRLPYIWTFRAGRLVCRLQPLSADQEKWIETESVVDRTDIELRILSLPRQSPRVVEVLFPVGMGLGEAKQFIYQELQELAIQTQGRTLWWTETPDEVILELAADSERDTVTIPLDDGVSERIAHLPTSTEMDWHTCALEFARSAGWTRQRAEEWIAHRLGVRSKGRTVLLTVSYRLDPPLARFLSELLFAGVCHPGRTESEALWPRLPVEFVAVPSLLSADIRHRADADGQIRGGESAALSDRNRAGVSVRAPRLRSVKGGAGLELDLGDDRPLPQFPAELRALLPRQGLVNYLEACALVKHLEALVHDADFGRVCEHWRQRRLGPCRHGCQSPSACACPQPSNRPTLAVMALYSAQVELLRHLIAQTAALTASPIPIEVGPPSAFAQRECFLALVSLTRSHTHRAVSYADHPQALVQALTRAVSGVILFGDPGTLVRRSQWNGPLDHLDESAAQRESSLVSQLVQYLQGHGPYPQAFGVSEGSRV